MRPRARALIEVFRRAIRGYEFEPEQYVIVTADDFAKIKLESTKVIEIAGFIDVAEVHPTLYEAPYLAGPDGVVAAKTYSLLSEALQASGKVGIGKVVMRDKQYLAAVRPYGKGLALSTMLFADEVVPQSEIEGLPARKPTVSAQEKKLAGQIDAAEWETALTRHRTGERTIKTVSHLTYKPATSPVIYGGSISGSYCPSCQRLSF